MRRCKPNESQAFRSRSLADAEVAEDDVEDILNIHAARQASERARRHAQFFRKHVLAVGFRNRATE
jgi:hypothetical protein